MIIEYTRNANATVDEKIMSLRDSVQMALNEVDNKSNTSEPEGSIFVGTAKVDPNKVYGGTWKKIKSLDPGIVFWEKLK